MARYNIHTQSYVQAAKRAAEMNLHLSEWDWVPEKWFVNNKDVVVVPQEPEDDKCDI